MTSGSLIQCPVCALRGLHEPPWSGISASYEICACCGTQFGYDDAEILTHPEEARSVHRRLRQKWVQNGATWWSTSRPAPPGWNAAAQLAALEDG